MAFYRKNLKWYHRLFNIFGIVMGVILLLLCCTILALPLYVIVGEDKTAEIVEGSLFCLWFIENPRASKD